jgi:hypothetical protein
LRLTVAAWTRAIGEFASLKQQLGGGWVRPDDLLSGEKILPHAALLEKTFPFHCLGDSHRVGLEPGGW